MSGIEIAGIVLGAIPLVISGLEHYGEGVSTIRKFQQSSREFLNLKRTLEVENDIFLNSIEILLKDDASDHLLAAMLNDMGNFATWRNPQLEQRLQCRLGRSYSTYFSAVSTLAQAVKDLHEALRLDVNGKGPFDLDQWSVKDAYKRAKFTLKIKSFASLVDVIVAQNVRINRLTQQSELLEPLRNCRKRVPDLEQQRLRARQIFEALQIGLKNSCVADHRASLYMRPGGADGTDSSTLRIILHHDVAPQQQLAWTLEEADIRSLDADPAPNRDAKKVRIQHQGHVQSPQHSQAVEVQDLCQSLQVWRNAPTSHEICLGYICDQFKLCRHGLFWPRQPLLNRPSCRPLTLESVIKMQSIRPLDLLSRRSLALGLAAGMLGLHNTPWLGKQWGKNEIFLFEHSGLLDVENLFISASIAGSLAGTAYFSSCQPIREETIFALGILLIELALESPFDELKITEDSKYGAVIADFTAADRLIEEVYRVAGPRYGDVVRRCIRCDFDHRVTDLNDAEMRSKVYAGVVSKLEMEIESLKL